MNSVNIQEMKARLELARAKAATQVAERMELAKIEAELSLLGNDKFQQALVTQRLREETTNKLHELNTVCSVIVETTQLVNRSTGENRKWNPSKRYGFGSQLAELFGLLSGIQYSVVDHAEQMRAATKLGADLIEATLHALGQLPYYSANYNEVVIGAPTNVDALNQCLDLIEVQLGIQLDKSLVTQANADRLYEVAKVRAERAAAEHELTASIADFVIRK